MHPILLKIGSFAIYSWGVAFAISVLAGIMVAIKRASRAGVDPEIIMNLSVVIIISAMAGSRIWYVITHLAEFHGHWLNIINPFQNGKIGISGFAMSGGMIAAVLASLVYVRLKRLNFFTLGDIIVPVFLVGAGIHRLGGCFMSGCCFGKPTDSILGVIFPEGVAHVFFPETAIWPTQLFASALGFFGFALVLWLERWRRFPGYTFWMVFIYYSIDRFIVDQFRYYEPSQVLGTLGSLTINVHHLLLSGLFLVSVIGWLWGWRTKEVTKVS